MKASSNTGDRWLVAVLAAAIVVLFGLAVWLWLSGRPPGEESAEAAGLAFERRMGGMPGPCTQRWALAKGA